jgi:factor associated with neutral sphingomyelinase activation
MREIKENMKGKLVQKINKFKSEFCEWIRILISLATDHHFDKVLEDPVNHVTKLLISMRPEICFLESKHLESINERFICSKNILVERIMPMTSVYGFVNLTDRNLYFHEICGSNKKTVLRSKLISIRKVLKRRYQLSYSAIEVEANNQTYYLNFKDISCRNEVYDTLIRKVSPKCMTENNLSQVTELWKNRMMSNFDYLMSINYIAQRSLNDYTQYPVFPWLITDLGSSSIDVEDPSIYRYFFSQLSNSKRPEQTYRGTQSK